MGKSFIFVIIWVKYVSVVTNKLEIISIYQLDIWKFGVKKIAVTNIDRERINLVIKKYIKSPLILLVYFFKNMKKIYLGD